MFRRICIVGSSVSLVALTQLGCGAPRKDALTSSSRPGRHDARDLMTAPELRVFGASQSLMTVLTQARPAFLVGRGTAPLVSVDGSPPADLSTLRLISVGQVHEVRMLRGTVTARFIGVKPNGDIAVGDVILVVTRAR